MKPLMVAAKAAGIRQIVNNMPAMIFLFMNNPPYFEVGSFERVIFPHLYFNP
jgi:hypothetical protein